MLTYTPANISLVVTGVADTLATALEGSQAGPVNRVCHMVPGEIAWDECDCGQLAQSVTSITPTNNFPQSAADTQATACGPQLVVVAVTLSLTRCVPVMDDQGNPPSCADLATSARYLEDDRWTVRTTVGCFLRQLYNTYQIPHFAVGVANTVGPQGACAGVDLSYQFALTNTCC